MAIEISRKFPSLVPLCSRREAVAAKVDAFSKEQFVEAGIILDEATLTSITLSDALRKALLTSFRLSSISTLSTAEKQAYALRAGEQGARDVQLLADFSKADSSAQVKALAELCGLADADVEVLTLALPYAARTECVLTRGGDDRLLVKVDDGKTNKYYTSPVPDPDLLLRSSCTASTVDAAAFRHADEAREKLLFAALSGQSGAFDELMESIRARLAKLYLPSASSGSVLLTPSGSDAEFAPTSLALARARRFGGKVVSIITAAGEVGSGTAGASGAQHFSVIYARREAGGGGPEKVEVGAKLNGVSPSEVQYIEIKPRDGTGAYKSKLREQEVLDAVEKCLSANDKDVVILHVLAGSKTGLCYPSQEAVRNVIQKHGSGPSSRLIVVVDACQLRTHTSALQDYFKLGCIVLITGSKYFGGPPFCGGILVPSALADELNAKNTIFEGLGDYFNAYDMPRSLAEVRAQLPSNWFNVGLSLRWAASLSIIETYEAIDADQRAKAIDVWCSGVSAAVSDGWPFLAALPETGIEPDGSGVAAERIGGLLNTIIPVMVRVHDNKDDAAAGKCPLNGLSADELKKVHRMLQEDLSSRLPSNAPTEDRNAAAFKCLIGQPVKLGGAPFGVVRIALGAQMVVDWSSAAKQRSVPITTCAREALNVDHMICDKLKVIAQYWHTVRQ